MSPVEHMKSQVHGVADQSHQAASNPLIRPADVIFPTPASAHCSGRPCISNLEERWREAPDDMMVKPFSITHWSADRNSILKIYRGFEPYDRHCREAEALSLAAGWGIAVPKVLATGVHEEEPWSIFSVVPGSVRPLRTEQDARQYLRQVRRLTDQLQAKAVRLTPGAGWGRCRSEAPSGHRQFLLSQLTERCRTYTWWTRLCAGLVIVESAPTVYLHGDLKPEHFLVADDDLHVVDWEACGRGPAACDYADVVFHVLRDLVYDEITVRSTMIALLAELGAPSAVLVWRLVRWVDRRRPEDLSLIPPRDLDELTIEADPVAACQQLTQIIAALRTRGVPR